ncbi:hypothetical protein [Streptomyces sp. B6B3]
MLANDALELSEPGPGVIADQVNVSVALVRPRYGAVVQVRLPADRTE